MKRSFWVNDESGGGTVQIDSMLNSQSVHVEAGRISPIVAASEAAIFCVGRTPVSDLAAKVMQQIPMNSVY